MLKDKVQNEKGHISEMKKMSAIGTSIYITHYTSRFKNFK